VASQAFGKRSGGQLIWAMSWWTAHLGNIPMGSSFGQCPGGQLI